MTPISNCCGAPFKECEGQPTDICSYCHSPAEKVLPLPRPTIEPRQLSGLQRNQPCPCGSGKKGKKCCGSAKMQTEWNLYVESIWAYKHLTNGHKRRTEIKRRSTNKLPLITALLGAAAMGLPPRD